MPSISPYLKFNGSCREAMTAYAEIFGGEVEAMMPFSDAPPGMPMGDVPGDRIMHASVTFHDQQLLGSDGMPGDSDAPAATHVMIELADVETARRVFDQLADGGEVSMPFAPTFFSGGFGSLRDRWGQLWMVGAEFEAE